MTSYEYLICFQSSMSLSQSEGVVRCVVVVVVVTAEWNAITSGVPGVDMKISLALWLHIIVAAVS